MSETIAGVRIPDSRIASEATELILDTTTPLIYHHSRRVFLFGSLQSRCWVSSPTPNCYTSQRYSTTPVWYRRIGEPHSDSNSTAQTPLKSFLTSKRASQRGG